MPLHNACFRGHEDVAKFLIDAGADKNATNQFGSASLHLAIEDDHVQVLKLLLSKGCPVNITNDVSTISSPMSISIPFPPSSSLPSLPSFPSPLFISFSDCIPSY